MRTKNVLRLLGVGVTVSFPLSAEAAQCSDGTYQRHTPRPSSNETPNANANEEKEEKAPDEDCFERDILFMPGAIGVFFAPRGGAGPFYGGGVQIAPIQWSHNNDRFGPSQGGFYISAAMLGSTREPGTMALFEAGGTASFERNASRRYLIPYFGATFGGLTHSDLGTSSFAYPLVGAHLYWHRNIMIDTEGGYHFPFQDVDRTRGPRAQLTARFSLW